MKYYTIMINDEEVTNLAKRIVKTFSKGGKVMVAGNGGSCADSMHFVAELVCTYKDSKRKGFPALCLNVNPSVMTAWANDYNYEGIFARQIEALGQENDLFIGISTSGKSKNILEAVRMCKSKHISTYLITGKMFRIKSTPRIQEHTITFIHEVCDLVERMMKCN